MKVKTTAIIVVYNKEITQSITCKRIKMIAPDIDVLVVDNSEIENSNDRLCKEFGVRYISMMGNKGLSKAYNVAIDNSKGADLVILFDDDTEITKEYFDILELKVEQNPNVDIFAPIIRGQDGIIYSPNEFNFLRNHFITSSTQTVSQESFNAIASCLAIRMRVFQDYRFNEKLFVDQVDQFFFCEQRKLGRKFEMLDVEILQHFYQRGESLTAESGWRRLKLRIYDVFRHARLMKEKKYIFLAFVKCCGLGVQIGKKSKSVLVILKAGFLSVSLLLRDV